ncbi:unnamed protein product [Nezara viridula]|uniref:Uncharacterized protein n=1 Tax=Nezara viridula TaxID=85310 RepID=A0A9P0HFZ7_NEZVI|nr:unnamed protein product [Nezara viridula]
MHPSKVTTSIQFMVKQACDNDGMLLQFKTPTWNGGDDRLESPYPKQAVNQFAGYHLNWPLSLHSSSGGRGRRMGMLRPISQTISSMESWEGNSSRDVSNRALIKYQPGHYTRKRLSGAENCNRRDWLFASINNGAAPGWGGCADPNDTVPGCLLIYIIVNIPQRPGGRGGGCTCVRRGFEGELEGAGDFAPSPLLSGCRNQSWVELQASQVSGN